MERFTNLQPALVQTSLLLAYVYFVTVFICVQSWLIYSVDDDDET